MMRERRKIVAYIKSVFIFAIPLMLWILYVSTKLPFSAVYSLVHEDSELKTIADNLNTKRLHRALKHFDSFAGRFPPARQIHYGKLVGNDSLVICIVTMDRSKNLNQGFKPRYLVQTAAAVDHLLRKDPYFKNKLLFICNVDEEPKRHNDAVWLQKFIPYIQKNGDSSFNLTFTSVTRKPSLQLYETSKLKREKEANDYVFCLNASRAFGSSYVLVLEDDVVPNKDILSVTDHVLRQKLHVRHDKPDSTSQSRDFSFLKLYYPEKWQGYAWESDRLFELTCFGFIGAGVFYILCSLVAKDYLPYKRLNFLLGFLVSITIASLLGRQALLELRRLSPQLYRFSPSPRCCTPGMLYNTKILPKLMDFIIKNPETNKDLAIYDFTVASNIPGYLLEPNLLHHIGMYSSLFDIHKPPREFLFSDN